MLVVKSAIESHRPMLNRLFFYVSSEDMESYRSAFPSPKYNFISGTLSIHQVVTIPGNKEAILYRNGSCGCSYCLSGTYKECESLEQFKEYPEFIQIVTHTFTSKKEQKKREKASVEEEDEFDLDEDEQNEWEEMFIETEASKYIQQGDVAVIKTGDDHPYYLLKVTSLFETESEVTDDYRHTFPPAHRVVEDHYLEIHRETNNGTVYYVDHIRKALISAFCIVGNCPELPTTLQNKCGKNVDMFIVDHDIHQVLSELAISE